ncbi:hypothetical protein [Natronoglycomyces albus]|uniref:Uncharacterized protein n=1 Tax=Natronoglycomyces albus TaxID=2811108 RepID=A0A895XL05_9ACTN|nr:hypothetical protein [Natronoglycomyces albus]QSB04482.1 hypothetical protein JQS30_11915 [Natronoglycomyces albus]
MDTQLKHQQDMYWRVIQRLLAVVASVALLGFATACDEADEGIEGGEDTDSTTSVEEPCPEDADFENEDEDMAECVDPDEPTAPPSIDPSDGISDGDSDDKSTGATTISGTIEAGVEHGCLVMTAEDGVVYGLFGGDEAVMQAGNDVTLHGEVDENVMSFCQQGTPFVVSQATLND